MNLSWLKPPRQAERTVVPETKTQGGYGFIQMETQGAARWTRREQSALIRESYLKNPVAYRAVRLVAEAVADVPWALTDNGEDVAAHPLLDLLNNPNPRQDRRTFIEALTTNLLDSAVKNCGLTSAETEITQNWKIGPSGKDMTDRYFASDTVPPAKRALTSYAPVHLSTKQGQSGDIACSWLRCGNRDSDGWDNPDISLPEGVESYHLRVLTLPGVSVREVTVSTPSWTYPLAQRTADLGTSNFILEVSQISASGLPGLPVERTVTII